MAERQRGTDIFLSCLGMKFIFWVIPHLKCLCTSDNRTNQHCCLLFSMAVLFLDYQDAKY